MHCLVCKLLNDSFSFSNPEFSIESLKKLANARETLEILWHDDDDEITGYFFPNDPEQKEIAYIIYK